MLDQVSEAERIRAAAIQAEPAHRRLMRSRRDGRILSAVMLPFFKVRPPRDYALLTTTGRKTGKRRTRCVRAVRRGDHVYIVALRPPALAVERPTAVARWVWNIRSQPRVTLRLRGGTFEGVAREIEDLAELEQAREAICETVSPTDYGECVIHLRGRPTRERIRELHRYWFDTGIPLVVELEQEETE